MNTIWTPEMVNIYNNNIEQYITNLSSNHTVAFTDGSYDKKLNASAYGIVMFMPEPVYYSKRFYKTRHSHKLIIKLGNVGAECEAVIFAVKQAIEHGFKKITIFYDFEGIYKWLSYDWVANKTYTENYVDTMTQYSKLIEIAFIKVKSHVGIYYNDLADKLANDLLKRK